MWNICCSRISSNLHISDSTTSMRQPASSGPPSPALKQTCYILSQTMSVDRPSLGKSRWVQTLWTVYLNDLPGILQLWQVKDPDSKVVASFAIIDFHNLKGREALWVPIFSIPMVFLKTTLLMHGDHQRPAAILRTFVVASLAPLSANASYATKQSRQTAA